MSAKDALLGKPCPRKFCKGTLKVLNSKPTDDGKFMQRFYGCNVCGCRPADNKRLIPVQYSQRKPA